MFILLPYNTDAPLYHYPITTTSLITTNVGLFWGVHFGPLGPIDGWLLHYGDGWHPCEWLTSNFMHLDVVHLIGNMIFLWVFGLITEGKLGWWRMLICYLAICLLSCAVEQTLLLSYQGYVQGSLGASAAIFGLMGMAFVWAPKNDVECLFGSWSFLVRSGTLDVPVSMFAGFFFVLDMVFLLAHGQLASSEAAHLLGGATGLVFAVALLKTGHVDCEGWDLFTLWRGASPRDSATRSTAAGNHSVAEIESRLSTQIPQLIAFYIEHDNVDKALETYARARDRLGSVSIDAETQLYLVKHLLSQRDFAAAVPLLEELVYRFPSGGYRLRLKLAHLLLKQDRRPQKALDILQHPSHSYPGKLESMRRRLIKRARQLCAAGVLELEESRS